MPHIQSSLNLIEIHYDFINPISSMRECLMLLCVRHKSISQENINPRLFNPRLFNPVFISTALHCIDIPHCQNTSFIFGNITRTSVYLP